MVSFLELDLVYIITLLGSFNKYLLLIEYFHNHHLKVILNNLIYFLN